MVNNNETITKIIRENNERNIPAGLIKNNNKYSILGFNSDRKLVFKNPKNTDKNRKFKAIEKYCLKKERLDKINSVEQTNSIVYPEKKRA